MAAAMRAYPDSRQKDFEQMQHRGRAIVIAGPTTALLGRAGRRPRYVVISRLKPAVAGGQATATCSAAEERLLAGRASASSGSLE